MSRDATIRLEWADGEYVFRLAWGQLAKLQEECDAGPYTILTRLYNGAWRIEDISNVIRWGLIGGGLDAPKALKLTRTYVEGRPPTESLMFAQAILAAGCMGAPEEDVAKKAEAADQSQTSPTGSSDLPPSTETEQ